MKKILRASRVSLEYLLAGLKKERKDFTRDPLGGNVFSKKRNE